MHLGIFAKTFVRPTLDSTLDAIAECGLTHVQFNMSCAGLPTLPDRLDEDLCIWIARSFRERGLVMAALSGTFNLCDPDESRLEENLHRLGVLASACRWLDTRIITLCTGTRDAEDMWTWHPENVRRVSWDALVRSLRSAVKMADRHEVTLAFEPERHNVVNSVARARMLLDQIGSPWLKVVIDPANLMRASDFPRLAEVLDEAFDWLGSDIVLAHAKDPNIHHDLEETISISDYWKQKDRRAPDLPLVQNMLLEASQKALPEAPSAEDVREYIMKRDREISSLRFPKYLADRQTFYFNYIDRLKTIEYAGALVLHGLAEEDVEPSVNLIATLINHI
jgi:sugar phosphate isomerase/epimerase